MNSMIYIYFLFGSYQICLVLTYYYSRYFKYYRGKTFFFYWHYVNTSVFSDVINGQYLTKLKVKGDQLLLPLKNHKFSIICQLAFMVGAGISLFFHLLQNFTRPHQPRIQGEQS